MSWQIGLVLAVIVACIVPLIFCEIAARFGSQDSEWDQVAERKRQTAARARKQSGEFQ